MKLNEFFENAPDINIEQLSSDSRVPMRNAIFFCLNGIRYDGHAHIKEAIKNGAKVIIHSKTVTTDDNAIYIKVSNVNETLKRIGEKFYNYPNDNIDEYLITGCYGRSSVSNFIAYYLKTFSKCGTIGIFGIDYDDKNLSLTFPALTALENLSYLYKMKQSNVSSCVFETSAISLFHKKFDVIDPDVFIYTNTSKICSDYQVCQNMYFNYIRNYLYSLEDNTIVVLNRDDVSFNEFSDSINNYITYGSNIDADFRIDNINVHSNGLSFYLKHKDEKYKVVSKLLGIQNVYNLTAAIVGLYAKGYDINDVISKFEKLDYVDGVMQKVENNVIIDCAYELDCIETVMKYAKNTTSGKIIGVLGINYSDDDNRIEALMKLCDKYLDVIMLTENESLNAETMDILNRCNQYITNAKTIFIGYRSLAIENAIGIANSNDTILILGKGNEKYMTMSMGKQHYEGDYHYAKRFLSYQNNG